MPDHKAHPHKHRVILPRKGVGAVHQKRGKGARHPQAAQRAPRSDGEGRGGGSHRKTAGGGQQQRRSAADEGPPLVNQHPPNSVTRAVCVEKEARKKSDGGRGESHRHGERRQDDHARDAHQVAHEIGRQQHGKEEILHLTAHRAGQKILLKYAIPSRATLSSSGTGRHSIVTQPS
ncbi:hypothetical protein SDC9_150620 [bioreactor metagenome]|uniref:Uncharacterized protein n=1 Tax=bioreactor metagenome TaxID=1076179 RepID=A0A645EPW0_9ZZZZ